MENTIDNHKLFRAHYLFQKVLRSKNGVYLQLLFPRYLLNQSLIDGTYLELTPLSMISDEDAIEVAKIMYGHVFKGQFIVIRSEKAVSIGMDPTSIINIYFEGRMRLIQGEIYCSISNGILDFLRSKSYALPYNRLSVEKQIEYGWIKLKA